MIKPVKYNSNPYILTSNNPKQEGMVMASGSLEEMQAHQRTNYYSSDNVEVRQHDLYLNDNSMTEEYKLWALKEQHGH